jgi:DNA polymerase-3 subunit alpha
MKVKKVEVKKIYLDMPDIDTDYETFGRDLVKEYIKDKYGKDYSCSVGTYTRAKLKTCIKDFSKVRGLSFDYTNKITKDIDDQIEYTWADLIEYATKSKALFKFVQDYPEIVHMTKYSLLSCKAASVHPSAVIIVPKVSVETGKKMNIYEWMPIKMIDGALVSEWEGKYTEASLFLKEDVLGLSQLDKFHNMLNLIEKNKRKKIDVNRIPFDDETVFKFFRKGWCEDVFQFGTMSLMNYCKQVKPTEFSDLVAMTALFRPGPIASHAHSDFAEIKNGKKKPKYDYGVENITSETYSLLVYQEQMMSIIHQLGGLSLIEAENARKYIKKKKHRELAALGDAFVKGAIENGCPEKEAKVIWDKMNAFSSYSFNKSHAVAYTLMSYWSQWFKVNYPLEFWTTSLQFASEADIPYRLSEMKRIGVDFEIRQPDVNYSEGNFTCDSENNRIFYSLNKIKGVGEVAAKNILDTRKEGGQFFSLDEFLSRVPSKVNKSVVKYLIVAGAFDLLEDINQPRDRRKLLEKYLIDIKGDKELPKEYNTEEAKISNSFWILEQKRLTGFGEIDYESMLPNKRMKSLYVDDNDFMISRDNTEVCLAGKLLSYTEREIKSGTMCSIQIDSNNTIISCTIWPDAYEKVLRDVKGNMLDAKGKVICINGTVKKDKFRNQKMLFSNLTTRMYIIS